jgi:4-hydroxybenzoate polyprenyltransferase
MKYWIMGRDIWLTMRPKHWVKNVFVFAPLFFSGKAGNLEAMLSTVIAFVAFCAISSAVYLLNDIADRERDRVHPTKSQRPIASGRLPLSLATGTTVLLMVLAMVLAYTVTPMVAVVLAVYAIINISYSFSLKHIVILDVFCIAAGFVLRVVGGGVAIDVTPSSWLITATFLLSLFLALAKRRHELIILQGVSDEHRPVLTDYTPGLVDELISVVTPVTLVSYLLYTVDPATIERFGSNLLYATGAFVVFGIFRYLYLIHRMNQGGSPTDVVYKDLPLLVAIVGWVLTFSLLIYFS